MSIIIRLKCDKCEGEVRPEPVKEATLDKIPGPVSQEVISKSVALRETEIAKELIAFLEENVIALQRERMELLGTLLGIGLVATYTVCKYTVFY